MPAGTKVLPGLTNIGRMEVSALRLLANTAARLGDGKAAMWQLGQQYNGPGFNPKLLDQNAFGTWSRREAHAVVQASGAELSSISDDAIEGLVDYFESTRFFLQSARILGSNFGLEFGPP